MLTLLVVLPLAAAAAIAFLRDAAQAYRVALGTSFAMLGLGVAIAGSFEPGPDGLSHVATQTLISAMNVRWSVGIDGVALVLILLTVFLAPITCFAARSAIEERQKLFWFWFLVLHSSMLGAFVGLDLFVFFVFWELMLVPMWLMIGIWGGKNRLYAGMKFFLYTVIGSLPMLVAIVYLALRCKAEFGVASFAFEDFRRLPLALEEQLACFVAFGVSFAIKVPLWPFHTWLPDAHTEAPTPGSVILAGVLLKMGGFGFFRYAIPLFPEAAKTLAPAISTLAVIAIVAGSLVAMVQKDIKRLVAYSSVAHMGAVMLGLFSLTEEGTSGAVFQMLAHGVSTGGLFLLVGFLYERRHTRDFAEFGGIAKVMPVFAVCFVAVAMSSIALPGTNGFVGEFLILVGTFKASPLLAAFAVLGAILGAWYMLGAVKKVFFGELTHDKNRALKDLSGREIGIMVPLLVAILWMGIGAKSFLDPIAPDVANHVKALESASGGR